MTLVCSYKFSLWKRYIVKRFFNNLEKNFSHIEKIFQIAEFQKVKLLVWGTILEEEKITIQHKNIEVIRLEDGFIRSVGLGVKLTVPISLVADRFGIYYDSTKPSELEKILQETEFNEKLILRARKIINLLRKYKINKYNLRERGWKPPKVSKKIIVVPGQVESDRSIKYGSPVIKTNIELLKEVRKRNPDAYIVYKPHPDTVGGYRKGYYPKGVLLKYCDEVCEGCSSFDLIEHADEIHTISSLFGFEALLRNKKVVCYGQPFYSGWGLTEDIYPNPRRRRKLNLYELVAGTIILYPMYVSLKTGKGITPEEAIYELIELKKNLPIKWKIWNKIQSILDPFIRLRKW